MAHASRRAGPASATTEIAITTRSSTNASASVEPVTATRAPAAGLVVAELGTVTVAPSVMLVAPSDAWPAVACGLFYHGSSRRSELDRLPEASRERVGLLRGQPDASLTE